jgi:hypothetical protein
MATLFDVALDVLSQSADFANARLGAGVLMKNWDDIIGEMTPDETQIAADRAAFTAYALAIVQLAARTKSQPRTKPALRASRKDILALSDPSGAAGPAIIADE